MDGDHDEIRESVIELMADSSDFVEDKITQVVSLRAKAGHSKVYDDLREFEQELFTVDARISTLLADLKRG